MVDASMRPLKIPSKFVPYMEKHFIYDLFYELGCSLVKNKPDDIVSFIKKEVNNYGKRKNTQRRIIFLAPAHIDIYKFGVRLSQETGGIIITLDEVVEEYSLKREENGSYNPVELANCTKKCIESKKAHIKGWIFIHFPSTKEQAKALQQIGVNPTHTIELLHTPKDYSVEDLWNKGLDKWTYEKFRDMLKDYKRNLIDLREVYKHSLKKVVIRGRDLEKIANDCRVLVDKMPHRGCPMLPRVVIVGPRGSRRRKLAKMLSKRFKLVYIHFWELLARGNKMDNRLGDEIRHSGDNIHINISLKLLEDRFNEDDCMRHGWVLTGFPNDETDFQCLDLLDMPPNRIIFLITSTDDCLHRLTSRVIDMNTGDVLNKNRITCKRFMNRLATHPADSMDIISADHEIYFSEIQSMEDYCGYRATEVDATGSITAVFERVENAIMKPAVLNLKKPGTDISRSLYNKYSIDTMHML